MILDLSTTAYLNIWQRYKLCKYMYKLNNKGFLMITLLKVKNWFPLNKIASNAVETFVIWIIGIPIQAQNNQNSSISLRPSANDPHIKR